MNPLLSTPTTERHTLVELLRWRAQHQPSQRAYTFLRDGEKDAIHLTYAELDEQARAIAAWLQEMDAMDERVLLLYPSGLDFIAAFFGSLYAGAVAVPAYPPHYAHAHKRLKAIVRDADPMVILSDADPDFDEELADLEWLVTPNIGTSLASEWEEPDISGETLAFLQYTSGSTAQPKGVMVTHSNLLHNLAAIQQAFEVTSEDSGVTWLPLYHDMGLIGGILLPLYAGGLSTIMSPVSFLQKPLRWLQAISRTQATVSGGPNFAYELCLENIAPHEREQLDLSSWQVASNGAEPIRSSTIERFMHAFEPSGFRREAFFPCYGLAEATLLVSGGLKSASPTISQLYEQAIVGCGPRAVGQTILIVDPDSQTRCPDGQVGEIWVAGESVAQGYWNRPQESKETFHAYLSEASHLLQNTPPNTSFVSTSVGGGRGGAGPFLRTGDLGFLKNGELFVTGRLKDLIIIRGRNHYPQDIELTVENAHSALRTSSAAAFSVEIEGQERLVIVQEVKRAYRDELDVDNVISTIRQAVTDAHQCDLYAILLLEQQRIAKTTSGKIQRHACRDGFLAGTLHAIHEWRAPRSSRSDDFSRSVFQRTTKVVTTIEIKDVKLWIINNIAQRVSLPPEEIDIHAPFTHYGLDSVAAVSLSGELAEWLERPLSPTLAYDYPSIESLSRYLADSPPSPQNWETRQRVGGVRARSEIAIIGLGCRFPGAENPDAFWQLLQNGVDAITEVPANRWAVENGSEQRWGGFLPQVDQFDAHFFGILPAEADEMDPQQRLLLEVSWEALEDAGIVPHSLAGSQTGVFIGISSNDYSRLQDTPTALSGTSNAFSIAANRLSYLLDLHGPSWAVDTACSSSLVAVDQAVMNLRQKRCDLAFAGGVNLILTPELTDAFSQAGMMAADGRCKTFDARADGYVRGEGVGIVLLKRHEDAIRDGDRILALIKGSAVNQDGRTNGLTAPNGRAQQAVIRQALADAGVKPAEISYLEAHGTGTELGDPIEMNALKAVLLDGRTDEPCQIGSVKSNIGHLEAAAGIAGLIKVVLSLQHTHIPPHLHLKDLNPHISLDNTPFSIPTTLTSWEKKASPLVLGRNEGGLRLAGVSSFGFGGTNAHLIVQEAPTAAITPSTLQRPQQILTLAAKSETALQQLAQRYHAYLAEEHSFADVCFTANTARMHFRHRLAIIASSSDEAREKLSPFSSLPPQGWGGLRGGRQQKQIGILTGHAPRTVPKTAFLFTGQGAQYVGMGQQLYQIEPLFRDILDRCAQILHPYLDKPLLEVLYLAPSAIHQTIYTQPALFALEYALAKLWQAWGIKPDIVMGHSVGEYVAACVAGAFTLEEGLSLIAERARLMQNLPPSIGEERGASAAGTMVAVLASEEEVAAAICSHSNATIVTIAAVNGPQNVVISGEAQAIEQIVAHLDAQGIETRALTVSHAFHSPLIEPMLDAFEEVASKINFQPLQIPLVSNLTGKILPVGHEFDATYWRRHTRESVMFMAGMNTLFEQGVEMFIEIGPKPILLTLGKALEPEKVLWLPSLLKEADDWPVMLDSLVKLWTRGADINWHGFHQNASCQRLSLPTYPFQRKRYWIATQKEEILPMDTTQTPLAAPSTSDSQQATILSTLRDVAAEWLRVPPNEIDMGATFQELGAGSIMLVDTIRVVDQTFGVRIKAQRFFEDLTTLEALATYLAEEMASAESRSDDITRSSPPKAPRTTEVVNTGHDNAFFGLSSAYYQMQWQPLSLSSARKESNSGHWLILSDRQGIGQQLSILLEGQGQSTTLLGLSTPEQVKALLLPLLQATELPCRGIVYLAAIDQSPLNLSMPQRLASDVEHQLHMALTLMQTLAQQQEKPALRLWLVTQGAQPAPNTPSLAVGQAPLWGLGRTCAIEQPELWGGLLDLDPNAPDDESAQQLLHTILASDGENQVAFRKNTRYVARFVPVEALPAPPFALRADASYLVTGGLKGLGYEVSRWLAQHGAQELILLGRTRLNESSLLANRISELEEFGVSVQYAAVDVADAKQMANFFNGLPQTSYPPIRGVVHCASVWQDDNGESLVRPLLQLDTIALSAVLRPKVLGTLLLAQQITDKLDFFTCFSSGASVVGSVAQSNYAAANAFLDAMAHHLSRLDEPATSINWGAISEIGFGGTPEGQKVHQYWESQGIGRISPAHVLAALEHLHTHHTPQIAVMNMDWPLLFRTHPDLADMAWANDVLKGPQPLNKRPEALSAPQSSSPTATSAPQISRPEREPVQPVAETPLERIMNQQLEVMSQQMSLQSRMVSQQIEVMSQPLELLRANGLPHGPQNSKKKAAPIEVLNCSDDFSRSGPKERLKSSLQFSLFYFGNDDADLVGKKYELIVKATKFADQHGFTAIWTPERHFHSFGGFSPNPSVLSAALAAQTERIRLRAGSVVLPLHQPIRVAEEWAVVDNLSQGRVDLSFATGWNPNDFVLSPETYDKRVEVTYSGIETVQKLWRGESISPPNGIGQAHELRIYPQPQQKALTVWLTCSGGPQRFIDAGRLGYNVLTGLLFQPVEELGEKIALYREARAQHGHDPETGHVTLMLHTYIGQEMEEVRDKVRQPFIDYLKSSANLWQHGEDKPFEQLSEQEQQTMLTYAFERYYQTKALIGTPQTGLQMVELVEAIGVNEIACLIDFGVDMESVLSGLNFLNQLKDKASSCQE